MTPHARVAPPGIPVGEMPFHTASNWTITASAVVVSGWVWVMTRSPALFVGGVPPQRPKSSPAPTATALHVASGSSTTSPLILVAPLLVSPPYAAIANGERGPRGYGTTTAVTVRVVVPVTSVIGSMAIIVVVPAETAVASPLKPAALLIVATDPFVVLHVTDDVRSCVGPIENVPVATNC